MAHFAKRHYEAIAQILQDNKPNVGLTDPSLVMWNSISCSLADLFGRDNPLFKRDRFYRACEPGANVRARSTSQSRR